MDMEKKVRVIVSEETTKSRIHARDGQGWEEKTELSNWMWVTNLFEDFSGDLKNTVKVCHSRWQIENKCFRRNSKYLERRSYLQTQRKCNNCISSATVYLRKYL